jgi:hypothetical protein
VAFSDLGYVFILGHSNSGHYCQDDGDLFGDRRMTLIHVHGIFQLCVRFCRCQGASPEHEQLSNYFVTACFLLLSTDRKQLLLWMFWIIMELMQWNAKLLHRAFSRN